MDEERYEVIEHPEVITAEERIAELEALVRQDQGDRDFVNKQLMEIIQNPGALKQKFNLTPAQAENVSAVLTAAGAGITYKYLARHFGGEIAGGLGGMLGGWLARKLAGG